MPKVDRATCVTRTNTVYPAELASITYGREKTALGNAIGLTQFGVNETRLKPGAASALRHWHESEDEFVYIVEGEATLIDDHGETKLGPGDCAGFKAGDRNGHHLINKSNADVLYIEIGTRSPRDRFEYPDVDLVGSKNPSGFRFTRKSGEPV